MLYFCYYVYELYIVYMYSNSSVVLLNILKMLDLRNDEIKIKIGKIGVSLEIKSKYFKKTYLLFGLGPIPILLISSILIFF